MKFKSSEEFIGKYVTVHLIEESYIEGYLVAVEENGLLLFDEDEESEYNYFVPHRAIIYIDDESDEDESTDWDDGSVGVSPAIETIPL